MIMKKLLTLSLIWLVVTACSGQSKGPQTTRTLKVADFTKLSMGSAFKINVEQGSSFRVTVSGREDDLDDLEDIQVLKNLRDLDGIDDSDPVIDDQDS